MIRGKILVLTGVLIQGPYFMDMDVVAADVTVPTDSELKYWANEQYIETLDPGIWVKAMFYAWGTSKGDQDVNGGWQNDLK